MKKSLAAGVIVGLIGALALGAAPAYAADAPTLPPAQGLYNVDCDDQSPQLWSFTIDGASSPIGAPSIPIGDACAGGGQTSPVDGKSYFVYYPGGPVSALATVDLATGVITTIATINGDTNGAWQLVITNGGSAFITDGDELFSIDLLTATTTLIGGMGSINLGAMGYQATTDTIYAFSNSDAMNIYTIDPATAISTNVSIAANWPDATCLAGDFAATDTGNPDGVAFDSNGIAWIQSDSCESNVMAFNPATGEAWMTGELFEAAGALYPANSHQYYSETFLMGPAPAKAALASTGTDLGAVSLIGITAAMAALFGVVLLTSRRRRSA